MSNKHLKVEVLRTELALRGLITTGTKATLVRRLDSAIREETKQLADSVSNLVSKKKEREDEDGDSNENIMVVDKFLEMGVRQLREEASRLGLSTSGSKKELIERLCSASPDNFSDATEDEIVEKREKVVMAIKQTVDSVNGLVSKKRERENESRDSKGSEKMKAVDKFREMGVGQLREEAACLGLSTGGSKKELLERLCYAASASSDYPTDIIKVKEDDITEERNKIGTVTKLPADKIKAVYKYRKMGVQQLRKEVACLGISTSGSKKELLERLCLALPDNPNDAFKAKEERIEKKEKMVTATKKGAAVLDQWLPDHVKTEFHVLQQGEEIYDAMLNQTNVGDNNNKFYVIQVLESDDGSRFMVYNRWGRVGIKGQDKLHGPYTSRDSAIQEFEQKFLAKTKNHWSNRKEFVSYAKGYTWLEMDYTHKEEELSAQGTKVSSMEVSIRETKLESRIAKFISLICNVSMMKQQMMEIGYNAEKLPLGKLSKSTILKGYDVLKRLADVIGKSNRKNLEQLSGEFYTVIPHDFGFKKMREFVIDTPQKLKIKLEMVESLAEIEVATKLLMDDMQMQEDPMYSHYQRLNCELMPLDHDSEEFSMIATYTKNTHAKTHANYSVDIVQILRVSRKAEIERFKKFSNTKNRMLLWHGSRLTNWTGILSQGLRIAPPEAPVTGYMFGKGIYFADMFSKSANYCFSSPSCSAGVLLLCEVALGDMAELLTAKYDADKLPEGKLSTKGVGVTAPDLSEARVLEDGIVVPLGKPKEQLSSKGDLLYNEYIVYNVDQIRMRYIVQVNFNYKR